jgi:hypothetical protein
VGIVDAWRSQAGSDGKEDMAPTTTATTKDNTDEEKNVAAGDRRKKRHRRKTPGDHCRWSEA